MEPEKKQYGATLYKMEGQDAMTEAIQNVDI